MQDTCEGNFRPHATTAIIWTQKRKEYANALDMFYEGGQHNAEISRSVAIGWIDGLWFF
jgi:hypothetical protein